MKKLIALVAMILLAVSAFGQTNEELKEQLRITTEALNELTDDYIELLNEYSLVVDQLQETTNTLRDSTSLLEEMRDQTKSDQDEIKELREHLEATIIPAYTDSMFSVGVGYSQPNGIDGMFVIDIPNFFLGFYGRFNFQFDGTTNMAAGIKIDL